MKEKCFGPSVPELIRHLQEVFQQHKDPDEVHWFFIWFFRVQLTIQHGCHAKRFLYSATPEDLTKLGCPLRPAKEICQFIADYTTHGERGMNFQGILHTQLSDRGADQPTGGPVPYVRTDHYRVVQGGISKVLMMQAIADRKAVLERALSLQSDRTISWFWDKSKGNSLVEVKSEDAIGSFRKQVDTCVRACVLDLTSRKAVLVHVLVDPWYKERSFNVRKARLLAAVEAAAKANADIFMAPEFYLSGDHDASDGRRTQATTITAEQLSSTIGEIQRKVGSTMLAFAGTAFWRNKTHSFNSALIFNTDPDNMGATHVLPFHGGTYNPYHYAKKNWAGFEPIWGAEGTECMMMPLEEGISKVELPECIAKGHARFNKTIGGCTYNVVAHICLDAKFHKVSEDVLTATDLQLIAASDYGCGSPGMDPHKGHQVRADANGATFETPYTKEGKTFTPVRPPKDPFKTGNRYNEQTNTVEFTAYFPPRPLIKPPPQKEDGCVILRGVA